MHLRRGLILGAAVAALLAAGCGDGDDGGPASSRGLVVEALGEIPASVLDEADRIVQLHVGDLAVATELAGLERPGSSDDRDGFAAWLGPLTGVGDSPVFVPLPVLHQPESFGDGAAVADELGWSLVDVDRFVEFDSPPVRFTVLRGDDVSPADGLAEDGDGVRSIGDGEDLASDIEARSAARPLGRPLRIRSDGDAVAVSLTTEAAQAWRGDGPTLADLPVLAGAAEALDEVGSVGAVLVRGDSFSVAGFALAADVAEPGEGGPFVSSPFGVVGLGWYVEDDEPMVRIVYAFAEGGGDARVAATEELYERGTVASTGEPISDVLELRSIEAEGSIVAVDVAPRNRRPPAIVLSLLQRGDSIVSFD